MLIQRSSGDFFKQKIKINDITIKRLEYFKSKISDKTVLHFGCADWPIFRESTNLHLNLCKFSDKVDGFDVDSPTIEKMRESGLFREGTLYDVIPEKTYDFLLIPETIEHVNNVEAFITSLKNNCHEGTEIMITAPNAFNQRQLDVMSIQGDYYIETVHPDHNYWFSIYTLSNVIWKICEKQGWEITFDEIGFLENRSMVYSLFRFTNH
jgi:2-polyprenyl-3-methyl-5-hydroxy-6-metoxy-1,4-benzoquinol methylase